MAKAAEWAERVASWQASGLTAAEFAEGKDFRAKTLQWWSSELRRRERNDKGTSEKPCSHRLGEGPSVSVRMARIVPRAGGNAELTVRIGKAEVGVRRGFDAALLSEIVSALGGGA